MDGEFDRELDDGGWGRNATYIPLLVQIRKQARAAGILETGERRERVQKGFGKRIK